MSDQRDYIGQVVRVTLDFIDERGYGPEVRAKVSPETARILAKPPWPFAWVPAGVMDELETIVASVGGKQACVDLGLTAGRKVGGTMMEPVIRMAMSFFGSTPAILFSHLDRFYSIATRGWHFEYEPLTDNSGIIDARTESAGVPEAILDVMRGNFLYVFEICGTDGEIDPPLVVRHDPAGAYLRFTARWH